MVDVPRAVRAYAEELQLQWINGNRKEVMRALTGMSSMRAACVAAHIVDRMHHVVSGNARADIDMFLSVMEGRLD